MSLLKTIEQILEEMKIRFNSFEEDGVITISMGGDHGSWLTLVHVIDNYNVIVYSICSFMIGMEKRSVIAEYLTRANCGILSGNWEFDMDNGKVMYKTYLPVISELVHPDYINIAVEKLIVDNYSVFNCYLPGIMRLIYSDITPLEAINEIKAKIEQEQKEAIVDELLGEILRESK